MYTYDIEQLLKDGSAIRLKPQGYSMYPLFHPGRDEAVIEAYPTHLLRRGDVILYRREQHSCASPDLPHYFGWLLSGRGQSDRNRRAAPPGSDPWEADRCCAQREIVFCLSSGLPHAFLSLAVPAPHPPVFLAYHGTFSQNFFRAVSLQMTGCRKKSSASASFHSPHHFHNTLESPASFKEHTI